MNITVCGIGRCRSEADQGKVWSVPICVLHWATCCKATDGGSLEWLRKHAKVEYAKGLPAPLPPVRRVAVPMPKQPVLRRRVAEPSK